MDGKNNMQGRTIPMSKIRRLISERMHASLAQTAQFTLTREIDMEALCTYIQEERKSGKPIKFMHVLIKAVSMVLKKHELMNAFASEDGIIYHSSVNMGIAVALQEGLLVPVIKDSCTLSLMDIAATYDALIPKAKTGKLSYGEMSEGTFTISNLGMAGIDAFTPILNYPESAILGVGRINERVILDENDVPVRRRTIIFSLTVDHRVVDGYVGAEFLASLAETFSDIENLRRSIG